MYIVEIEKRSTQDMGTQHFAMLCTTEEKMNEFVQKIKKETLKEMPSSEMSTDGSNHLRFRDTTTGQMVFVDAEEDLTAISEFRGEHEYLSNFYESPIVFDGLVYGSVEAAFQAQKCKTKKEREQFTNLNPSQAKRLGRHVELRSDWEEVKDNLMYALVYNKFASNPTLLQMLVDTEDRYLYEGNRWRDAYWGVPIDTYTMARNHLGKILEHVREELLYSDIKHAFSTDEKFV